MPVEVVKGSGGRGDNLILTGGSFWSLEYHLTGTRGAAVEAGYAGNHGWKPVDDEGRRNPPPNFYNLNGTGFSEAVRVTFQDPACLRELFARYVAHLGADQTEAFNTMPDFIARYRRAMIVPDDRVRAMAAPALRASGLRSVAVERGSLFFAAEARQKGYWLRDREPFALPVGQGRAMAE